MDPFVPPGKHHHHHQHLPSPPPPLPRAYPLFYFHLLHRNLSHLFIPHSFVLFTPSPHTSASSSFWTQNAGGANSGGAATAPTPTTGSDARFSFHDGTTTGGADTGDGGGGVGVACEADKGYPIPGANLSPDTVRAGQNLDEVIATLLKNFGAGSDYFKVLVKVFQSVLLDPDHDRTKDKGQGSDKGSDKEKGQGKEKGDASHEHLKNFYMIVPALCISWTDAALQAKDNMFKATRSSMHGSRLVLLV